MRWREFPGIPTKTCLGNSEVGRAIPLQDATGNFAGFLDPESFRGSE